MGLQERLEEIIHYDSESVTLDYKKEQYVLGKNGNKHEFLKDVCGFVNHPSPNDKFIIIGVKEVDGIADSFEEIGPLTDEAKYQQLLFEYLEPKINFEYKAFEYQGKQLAYFRFFENTQRPYLFKKEFQSNGKTLYKEGDGLIRQGTSTRRLVRSDFENIYKDRFVSRDRSKDLQIISRILSPENESSYALLGVKLLEIDIQNLSNSSIEFDAELVISNQEDYLFLTDEEVNKAIDDAMEKPFYQRTPTINFDISVDKRENFLKIERLARKSKHAVMIPQKGIEIDLFCQTLYVLTEKEEIEIYGQITIRCDEFNSGPLVETITFKSQA